MFYNTILWLTVPLCWLDEAIHAILDVLGIHPDFENAICWAIHGWRFDIICKMNDWAK